MRKKLYSILAFIFLLFASFGLSACKGKYDNLQFRVYYAFSADSENWQDGTSGINCFYGEDEGSLRQDSNGNAKIYIKIDVENVKAKNVDTIFVSKQTATNASTFSSATVKENQVFEVEVSGKLSMTLKLLETNSQKSALVNVSASVPLEDIEVDNSIKPAVMVGKQLNLAQFKDEILTFKPLDETNNTLTNQTAVNYAVSAVGYFDAAN